ncbi:MAG: DNA-directed RNA polymerase subunit alpha, partial [bacterium]
GEKVVTARDIEPNSMVEIVNPEEFIATLTSRDTELDMELKIEKGLGYLPVGARKEARLAIGAIAVDAFFTPVRRVDYEVEDMRVGERTDYNRLRITILTDGTISPSAALHKAANILKDHFDKISAVQVQEFEAQKIETKVGSKKRGRPKKTEK